MTINPPPEETIEIADAPPEGAAELAENGSPEKTKWRTALEDIGIVVGVLGLVVGILGIVIGLVQIAMTPGIHADPLLQFRLVCVGYALCLLSLLTLIGLSDNRWVRLSLALIVLLISSAFFSFVRSFEAGQSYDESVYDFERDNQYWTVGRDKIGVPLGEEPFVSTEHAFAGRRSLAFDITLGGINKTDTAGLARLTLAGYLPSSGSTLIAHVYLPPDAADNVLAQFALAAHGKELVSSTPVPLYSGRWTSVSWVLPEEEGLHDAELALQFYLGWPDMPVGTRVQGRWAGRVFVDSIEVIPPASSVSAAYITPTQSPFPSPTPTVTPTPTTAPSPTETTPLTATAEPTYTLTPTPSPTPTSRPTVLPPTSTPALQSAPVLISPLGGSVFIGAKSIDLQWSWTRDLGPQESFAVRVWPEGQEKGNSIAWVDKVFYRLDLSHFEAGGYNWNVAVVRPTQEKPFWEPVSYDSSTWTFEVRPGAPLPDEQPKPTPTPR